MIRVFPVLAPYQNCGPYGMRGSSMHYGVDLCAPTGTQIVAVDNGTVSYGTDPIGGNVAILHASDGNAYYFAHMLDVQSGSKQVQTGDPVGRVDMTGNAMGTVPHLHFEWWPSGAFQRPAPDPTSALLAALGSGAPTTFQQEHPIGYALLLSAGIIGFSGALAWAIRGRPLHLSAHWRRA